jgi:hypothetical protein
MTEGEGNGVMNNVVPFDYDVKEKSSDKVPFFNGDFTSYPFWKTKMYSHIMGIDDELWELVEEGVSFENMDEGVVRHTEWSS